MKSFLPLNKHAVVRIIAPGASSPVHNDVKATHWEDLKKCCDVLKHWGLTPVYSPQIFGEHKSYYNFANTDAARYADFVDAFESDAAFVWSFRGGYGSDRVINAAIKNNFMPSKIKLFVGFSDVTNIHSFIFSRWQWPTLHALSLRQLGLNQVCETDVAMTRALIVGEKKQFELPLVALNLLAKKKQVILEKMTGGNLTVIQSALGTPWQPFFDNTILLLEDTGEAPYRIARILQQFLASGVINKTAAILLGDFIPKSDMDLVLTEFADQAPVPVFHCVGVGHGPKNFPLPLGVFARIVTGTTTSLSIAI